MALNSIGVPTVSQAHDAVSETVKQRSRRTGNEKARDVAESKLTNYKGASRQSQLRAAMAKHYHRGFESNSAVIAARSFASLPAHRTCPTVAPPCFCVGQFSLVEHARNPSPTYCRCAGSRLCVLPRKRTNETPNRYEDALATQSASRHVSTPSPLPSRRDTTSSSRCSSSRQSVSFAISTSVSPNLPREGVGGGSGGWEQRLLTGRQNQRNDTSRHPSYKPLQKKHSQVTETHTSFQVHRGKRLRGWIEDGSQR